MSTKRNWSPEEVEYIRTKWGRCAVATIAKRLGRSELAISKKAYKLRLGPQIDADGMLSMRALMTALGYCDATDNYTGAMRKWIAEGLPVAYKPRGKMTCYRIRLDSFWRWAGQHRNKLNFARFEEGALGEEPDWVRDKRSRDAGMPKNHGCAWTSYEDALLKTLLAQQSHTMRELAQIFQRTEVSIANRIEWLGLKLRPVPMEPAPWTPEQEAELARMRAEGYSNAAIAERLGRSEGGCRQKFVKLRKRKECAG